MWFFIFFSFFVSFFAFWLFCETFSAFSSLFFFFSCLFMYFSVFVNLFLSSSALFCLYQSLSASLSIFFVSLFKVFFSNLFSQRALHVWACHVSSVLLNLFLIRLKSLAKKNVWMSSTNYIRNEFDKNHNIYVHISIFDFMH